MPEISVFLRKIRVFFKFLNVLGFEEAKHREILEKFIDLCENTVNSLRKSERDLHVAVARLMEMLNLMINYAFF